MTVYEAEHVRQTGFTSIISLRTLTRPILLETFCCPPNQGSSIPFLIALMREMESLVSQPYFQIDGASLRVESLVVQGKTVVAEIEARTQEIPSL
jgi:hypothetical protein